MPLLSIRSGARAAYERLSGPASASEDDDSVLNFEEAADNGPPSKRKRWWNYLPLCLMLVLLFAPHYSILVMLVSYFVQICGSPLLLIFHLSIIYSLTFLACCSLIVCVVRDPGAIRVGEGVSNQAADVDNEHLNDDEEDNTMDLRGALLMPVTTKSSSEDDDFNAPHKWCRKCWAPKPERTHHCSVCGRCVLKMDHHCPWLAQKCVGHWTYTAFLHFLFCITLLGSYVSILSARIVYVAFFDPFLVDENTALHSLFLSLYGAIFAMSIGSFLLWHVYLVTTNQTSLENLSPFLLLRYLPQRNQSIQFEGGTNSNINLTQNGNSLSHLVREHQLSSSQRRHVRYAHGYIRMYDVGWRKNWGQIIGVRTKGWRGWAYRILYGGGGLGDGKTFPHNPHAEGLLARLAAELANEDKTD